MRSTIVPPGCDPDAIVLVFPVPPERCGQRLDRFVQTCIPRLSRTRAQAIVEACARRSDGRRRRSSERVRNGETVLLVRERFQEPEAPIDFEVLHSDAWVVAIDKPAGLAMHPTATYHRGTLSYQLRQRFGEAAPRLAHRLDRETSGVVLCGADAVAERFLQRAFESRQVDKTYYAIVRGEVSVDAGQIDLCMGPARQGPHMLMEVRDDAEGLPASTAYRVLQRCAGYSWLEVQPRTGRQHQIRVHLAAIGHPIVGDKLYGPDGAAVFFECLEAGVTEALRRRLGHDRQALHAHAVTFPHPKDGRAFSVRSEMALDLRTLWTELSVH